MDVQNAGKQRTAGHRGGTRHGLAAQIALVLACVIAGLPGLTAVGTAAAQTGHEIEIVVQPWLCPAGYDGEEFAADCIGTPEAAEVNLSVWWGDTGGEAAGRFFAETPPRGDVGVSALIPLPAGQTTTIVVDNRFSQTDNPPIRGADCTDENGQPLDGLVFPDYGSLEFEIGNQAAIACDIYLVPDGGDGRESDIAPREPAPGTPDGELDAGGDAATATAISLSELEAAGDFDQLYNQMHPEARAIIPRAAVVGWFEDEHAPRLPGVITEVTGVRFVDWTWPVTGQRYPRTAEVSFLQPFGPAGEETLVDDTIRLVEVEEEWTWFFGRDAGFVEQPIAAYAPDFAPLGDGQIGDAPPWGIDTAATPGLTLDQVVGAMPADIAGRELDEEPMHNGIPGVYPFAAESMHYIFEQPAGSPSASVVVNITALPAEMTVATALPRIEAEGVAEQAISGDPPPFAVMQSDVAAEAAYLLAVEETEQYGPRSLFVWGPRDGHTIITIWAQDDVELELAVDAIVAALAANGGA